jgi:hypothetical protein
MDNQTNCKGRSMWTYCTRTTIAHKPKVALVPKLLKNIVAMGWSLFTRASRSVPMQNANDMLMAEILVNGKSMNNGT